MPDSNANAQLKNNNQNASEPSMLPTLMRYRRFLIIFAHIATFAVSLMLSFLVANNMQFRRDWLVGQYPFLLLFVLTVKLPVFGLFRQYRLWWRYVGISDLLGIFRATLVSTLII